MLRGVAVWRVIAGYDHIDIAAPAPRTDQPLMPVGNGSLGAVSSRHFGGIWLRLISALPAPDDEPNTGSRRAPECHRHLCHLWCHEVTPKRRAGFGFHLTASAVSSAAR